MFLVFYSFCVLSPMPPKRKAKTPLVKEDPEKKPKAVINKDSPAPAQIAASKLKYKLEKREDKSDPFSKQLRRVKQEETKLFIQACHCRRNLVDTLKSVGATVDNSLSEQLPVSASVNEIVVYHEHTMSVVALLQIDLEAQFDSSDY